MLGIFVSNLQFALWMGSEEIKVIKVYLHCRGHIDDLMLQMGFSLVS